MVEAEVDFDVAFVAGVGVGFFMMRDLAPSMARNCGCDVCSTLVTPFLGFGWRGGMSCELDVEVVSGLEELR